MKIAIVGAHGVGKTTLARELSKALNYPILPDTASEALKKGFIVNEDTPPENQLWILCKQIEYERSLLDNFVADKTLFDNIVYARQIFNDPHLLTVIEDVVKKLAKYDLYLYLPIEIPLVADGRSIDPVFQKRIDYEYTGLLNTLGIKYYEVRGNIPERVQKALELIRLQGGSIPILQGMVQGSISFI